MPPYGNSLDDWTERLKDTLPGGQRDWSVDVAVHLGLALAALNRLKAQGVDTRLKTHKLVEGALQEAWRELLFIRMRNIPVEILTADVPRPLTLTRNGHIINGSDQTRIPTTQGSKGHSDHKPESNSHPKSRGSRSRYRRARAKELD